MDNLLEWKKHQRKQLITAREALPADVHQQWSEAISGLLKQGLSKLQKMTIGIYWPFRGEYDPRLIAEYFIRQGASLALPEVIGKHQPLCFREWLPDTPMKEGAYGIPVPAETRAVMLDAVIIPMVGFDQQGYRLGYGSGYFDRTLATYYPQPLTIGIAFEMQRLENLYPQPHDIAMHYIVTEVDIFRAENHGLVPASVIQNFDE
ncbi:5-formyltetrahydrofolate cyclo-ligase [Nitrosomonas sp. Nm166]|uniref:5-formyltetrahydrofolate cyclo-ligase n=1 Tax=Nitrosomonas sp. Nm166 TaxID=1881054 RepID=UPI0008E9EBDA|nr:5-formyltetrahydrofolate cyclo-ligase [Nitrosomonas sp. Nm166]SFE78310.1 5,10-methenyltetrahydrofolate synthetase [Nitrosomonas sp. Nm166]